MLGSTLLLELGCRSRSGDEDGAHLAVASLTVEHQTNPSVVDRKVPLLSWKLSSSKRGTSQSAYRILVASTEDQLEQNNGDAWDSGTIASEQSVGVAYAGSTLASGATYYWKVRVWDQIGASSDWSDPARFHMGLLDEGDWEAEWIGIEQDEVDFASPSLRKEFEVRGAVKRAYLYASALGVYEVSLNGERVGRDQLAPGWTDYHTRVQYQAHEVTLALRQGTNALGAVLGAGWYSGELALAAGAQYYGTNPWFLAQLVVEYEEGTSDVIVTDSSWKGTDAGPIRSASLFDGESYDASREMEGWDEPGYDDSSWQTPDRFSYEGRLVAQQAPTVQVVAEIEPVEFWGSDSTEGVYVFDLGQNFAGKVRLVTRGEGLQEITLRHAEVLQPASDRDPADAAGNDIYTANLRGADATDTYVCRGSGIETYVPHFTYHGFRYVEVRGLSETPTKETLTGLVMRSALDPTGSFETSNAQLNQLQHNIYWSLQSNLLSIPTDCPQRDERAGWTGDVNAIGPTAAFNLDVRAFLGDKWMQDVRDAQLIADDGQITNVVPNTVADDNPNVSLKYARAGWADAVITVPYHLWQRYGDTRVIAENYGAMTRYHAHVASTTEAHLVNDSYWSWGDWLNVSDATPKEFISQAYFVYTTRLLSEMAAAIGETEQSSELAAEYENARSALNEAYVQSTGLVSTGSQTAFALALDHDLIADDTRRSAAAQLLVDQIDHQGGHLTTGYLGTPSLLPALSENDHLDEAYDLLLQEDYPSWLHAVNQGATTQWERWDSIGEDGSYANEEENSFNHHALGAVGDWMVRNVGGLENLEPGFKLFSVKPRVGGALTSARVEFESVYGTICSEWEVSDDSFRLSVRVPPNTRARIWVPAEESDSIEEGGLPHDEVETLEWLGFEDGYAGFEVGSGSYDFEIRDP